MTTPPPLTTLIIARHGNTFGPGETPRRVGARTDLPLTDSGIEQAVRLGQALAAQGIAPDIVYSSKQRRTRQTAALAVEQIDPGIAIEALAIFNELDYGPDENLPEDAVLARIGEAALKAWDECATPPPGWLIDPPRLIKTWQEFGQFITKNYAGRTAMVVTSNGTARFAPHMTGDFEAFRAHFPLKLSTGAYGVMRHDGIRWAVESWNVRPS